MIIKSSTAIRTNYNEISDLCKRTNQPVFLTKNGEGDLVVMSLEAYENEDKMRALKAELLRREESRLNGAKTYSTDEVRKMVLGGSYGN